jgi:hypothetical protein
MTKDEMIQVLNFKYPGGGFDVDHEGYPYNWTREEVQPTISDIEAIFATEEFKVYLNNAIASEGNSAILHELTHVDLKSIRALREWLVQQPDAPQFIKDYEEEATALRNQLVKN